MTDVDCDLPALVAHRGNAADYPENTLEGLQSAVDLGLRHVEFDVQLTADLVPVVLHDADLQRVAARPDRVHDLAWPDLRSVPIAEPSRFGTAFAHVRAPALARLVDAIQGWPGVTAFVEVKRASLRRFGPDVVLERVAAEVRRDLAHCVPISFDLPAVRRLRELTGARIGWVLDRYDEDARALARAAAPEFLFVDIEQIPAAATQLWPGPWQWAVYEVRTLEVARRCARLGAALVETMQVRAMLDAYAQAGEA